MEFPIFSTKISGDSVLASQFFEGMDVSSVSPKGKDLQVTLSDGREYLLTPSKMFVRQINGGSLSPAIEVTEWPVHVPPVIKATEPAPVIEPQVNPNQEREISMSLVLTTSAGHTTEVQANLQGRLTTQDNAFWGGREAVTEDEFRAWLDTITDAKAKTTFTTVITRLVGAAAKAATTENPPAGGEEQINDEAPEGTDLTGSNVFDKNQRNAGGTGGGNAGGNRNARRRGPMTEEERNKAKLAREARKQEMQTNNRLLEDQLATANNVLKENPEFLKVIEKLRHIVTHPFGGACVGVYAPVTTTNTRIKAKITNTIPADKRQWHPNAANKDLTKTGKQIQAKYAKGEYEVELVESTPGTVSAFIVSLPVGLKPEHLNSLTNAMTQNVIEQIHAQGTPKHVPVPLDKHMFTSLLATLNLPACFLVQGGTAIDKTQAYYKAEPRESVSSLLWYALKAFNSEGRVTKLATQNYLPLSTYDVTTVAKVNLVDLTQLIFGKTLLQLQAAIQATKFEQLTPQAAAKFTGDAQAPEFTGFANTMEVFSYTATAKDRQADRNKVSLKLPAVRMTEASGDTASKPAFVKSKYTEAGYQPTFRSRADTFKEALNSTKRTSKKSLSQSIYAQTAEMMTAAQLSAGGAVRTSKPDLI